MQYCKVVPSAGNAKRFRLQDVLPKLRRDEWLMMTEAESKTLCGVKDVQAALVGARARKELKQSVAVKTRSPNGTRTFYLRLY